MIAEIIAVGTELLLGDIVNTNAQYLAQNLAAMGISVHYQTVVGDNRGRLEDVIRQTLSRSNIVITTGGLGPTADDLTKETICGLLGLPLKVNEERLETLKRRFQSSGREMTENNVKQVMFPDDGIILDNPNGTAPGLCIHKDNRYIFLLPGPPSEMIPMFEASVKPMLAKETSDVIHSLSVEFFGIGESALETKLIHLMDSENPTVAPYAKQGQVRIRITAKAPTLSNAKKMIEPVLAQIKELVGEYIYGYDGDELETVAVSALKENGLTVATAESCTGGLLAQRLTSIPGCSDVFHTGFITYSADSKIGRLRLEEKIVKKYGVVSPQVAAHMAIGAAREAGADIGLSTTGVAGPTGLEGKPVGTVFVGLYRGGRVWVKELGLQHFSRNRNSVRNMAASHALDMLRRAATPSLRYTLNASCLKNEDLFLPERLSEGYSLSRGKIRWDTLLVITSFFALLFSLGYLIFSAAAG